MGFQNGLSLTHSKARGWTWGFCEPSGDCDLIHDGIHENFLQLHYHDPLLQKTILNSLFCKVHCLNALGVSDLIHSCVMRSYNMSLYVYHAPITIMIHRLLARVERPTIEWPKSFQRYRTLVTEKMEVLRSWQTKIAPFISRHLSVNTFVEDTVSPLLHILSPADLRPVALHLLSEKERNELAQLVSTMVDYSLTYKHKKSSLLTNHPRHDEVMDASLLCFEPPIQDFVSFKDYKLGHYELKSAVKQVIMHEAEKQKIVRESMGRSTHSAKNSRMENIAANDKQNGIGSTLKSHGTACIDFSVEQTKNISQKVIPKAGSHKSSLTSGSGGRSTDGNHVMKESSAGNMKKPSMRSVNFFDRFKKLSKNGVQNIDGPAEKPATVERDVRPLLFKFNEGFTNAVKRPVRIREFLF
ncbi:hypothetical protein Cgig2_030461 [Carnegiea gigantea]|uniref:Uncharacterized protein n=1 Tax=Carnegiea gigantea TaxID=171969 RepID=A0A9Q1KP39_9CARY|nr:hypothetical protein Cgig2_030461 [Carnegiea gigantea]